MITGSASLTLHDEKVKEYIHTHVYQVFLVYIEEEVVLHDLNHWRPTALRKEGSGEEVVGDDLG